MEIVDEERDEFLRYQHLVKEYENVMKMIKTGGLHEKISKTNNIKGHRVQIEGNNIFEIRKYVRPCFTSVNRPQASHLLPHITHSIEIYICMSSHMIASARVKI